MPAQQHASTPAIGAQIVEAFEKGRANRRLLMGQVAHVGPWKWCADGIKRRLVSVPVGARIVLDLWERNDYGTTRWRVVVFDVVSGQEPVQIVPSVRPGVAILADIQGAIRVRAFLRWLRENGDILRRSTRDEIARIELHFMRENTTKLRATTGEK